MTPLVHRRAPRRFASRAAVLTALTVLLAGVAAPVHAEPLPPNESGNASLNTLRKNLEAAATGYLEAKTALEHSKKIQTELSGKLTEAELDMVRVRAVVGLYAAQAYKTGRLGVVGVLVNSRNPDAFLQKASALDKMTMRDQERLKALLALRKQAADAKAGIDGEIRKQASLLAEMTKRETAAERALTAFGSKKATPYDNPDDAVAAPAPRNSDGSWPRESPNRDDPTTTGRITPRLVHSLNEAKKAGFTRYTACYRPGDMYEHPKGRACDFSSTVGGFSGNSIGTDRFYGDRLASYFVANADRLGVLYVIWYCNIWINGGWRTYHAAGSRCGDDPSGDHTNHVHLSVL